ncbi:hypothetical protein GALL_275850 [mine drainage metagenome]|uniref:Uncharacterized protein n=1 Tax=mine drainage metagenome TaxID=410659 RepID=A0A1J5R3L3_9ZZZZ
MDNITSLDKFVLPIGKQSIELQQIEYEGGGMALMRVRIREGSRFTVFDVDPGSAERWGRAMIAWAEGRPA